MVDDDDGGAAVTAGEPVAAADPGELLFLDLVAHGMSSRGVRSVSR
jgi:hypothetical protein